MTEPKVQVGILSAQEIKVFLKSEYCIDSRIITGEQTFLYKDGHILWNKENLKELTFLPVNKEIACFELQDVTIGINFHWERKENQIFQETLRIIVDKEQLTAINIIGVESYLTSVISSEMSATASLELLKAHAVISRSWLLAQIEKQHQVKESYSSYKETDDELIRWYDREDHGLYDVCADDHCQRYQGITRASTAIVREAIKATYGQILMFERRICDARFSKCCGGALEEFSYCWEDAVHPYLVRQADCEGVNNITATANTTPIKLPDLTKEEEAEKWIRNNPEAFCNTQDKKILSQVLNNYDQETTDFYRWKVSYTREELSALIRERSGVDYGDIIDLIPIARGTSGRLWKLQIVGSKRTRIIGKELEIRRTLSPTHLYSSAFVIDKEGDNFILTGAGWGHGVGLCQIGAAVMGERGYDYKQILLHYYVGSNIEKLY